MAAGVTVIIVLFTCFVCCTGSLMGIVSWLLPPKALKSTYSNQKPYLVAFVDVQILTQRTCKPTELHTRFLMKNGFATLLAQFIRVASRCILL